MTACAAVDYGSYLEKEGRSDSGRPDD